MKTNISILKIDGNSPINYHKSDIDNTVLPSMPDLGELTNVFKKSRFDIFNCNTSKCLRLIYPDNIEISLHQYAGIKPDLIRIIHSMTKPDNDIIISPDLLTNFCYFAEDRPFTCKTLQQYNKYKHHRDYLEEIASHDFNGYDNCVDIINAMKRQLPENRTKLSALEYCAGLSIGKYNAYIPALGQLNIFFNYSKMIEYLIWYIDKGTELHPDANKGYDDTHHMFSSSLPDCKHIFTANYLSDFKHPFRCMLRSSDTECSILPFFTDKPKLPL